MGWSPTTGLGVDSIFILFFFIFTFKKKINGQNNIVFGWVDVVALEFKTV
jgi:hypothetical protein